MKKISTFRRFHREYAVGESIQMRGNEPTLEHSRKLDAAKRYRHKENRMVFNKEWYRPKRNDLVPCPVKIADGGLFYYPRISKMEVNGKGKRN